MFIAAAFNIMAFGLSDNSPSKNLLARIAIAATLALLPLVYFFPAVLGKVTLAPGDGWTQIFGIRILIGQMIAHGQLPLWNPYIFAGMPLLASIQPGALYPPTWLFAVLSPQWAMNLLVLTTYHLALIGTYLYARRIGANRIGAMVAGLTFTFGGYMIAHLGHTNRINAAAWLPWILLAIEELYQRARWRWVAAGAFFIALQLFAGEPQMTLYTTMTAGAYALFTLLFRTKAEGRLRFVAALAAMAICGALLSLIQLQPEREMLRLGDRAGIDYHYFTQYSFPPRQLFSLFFPYFFGGAALPPYRVTYWGGWNSPETCGYVGMAAWVLALAGVFLVGRDSKDGANRLVLFWVFCAVTALLLSFGSNLPFGIYHLMYYVPVYKLFRAPGRHLLEFNFAIGVLAGMGVTALGRVDRALAKQVLLRSLTLVAVIVGLGVIAYCFFGQKLATEIPRPSNAGSLANAELYFPVVCFGLTVLALLIHARRWSTFSGAILVAIVFIDLASFGFFYEWRTVDHNIAAKLADPPSVKFIKQREPDLNSFRVVSHSELPFGKNTDLLNYPNISIARGVQSVNGYDPVRLGQMAEVAGRMTLDGVIEEPMAFAAPSQGFNLLNAKYLLRDRAKALTAEPVIYEGIRFDARPMNLSLNGSAQTQLYTLATADELAIVSSLSNATQVADGTPVLRIKLHTSDGHIIERDLEAGRDTSAGDYERPETLAAVKHRRASVVEMPWADGLSKGINDRRYLARLKFDRAEIERVEMVCPREGALSEVDVNIARAAFFDSATQASQPLDAFGLPPERWRKLAEFGEVELYENLKVMPRAWFVPHAVIAPSREVLRAIKTGRLPDGSLFNPTDAVLLESELFANRQIKTSLAGSQATDAAKDAGKNEVTIARYEPNRIELQTNNASAGFLVLSEIYYRGWEALVDGQRSSVDRVNFTLRGLELPPGNHKVEFVFRAHSFRNGAVWSVVGLLLLCIGGVVSGRKRKMTPQ
ncbi:MAG: YfhO family protein [Acidobacteriota bacterium]